MLVHEMISNERYNTLFENWLTVHNFEPSMVKSRKKDSDKLKWHYAKCVIAGHIWKSIEKYGETGYGDKPEDMDTVEYWLAHVDFERLKENQFRPICG